MSDASVTFGQKVVTEQDIHIDEKELHPISDDLKQVIQKNRIKSLEALLGSDAKQILRKLVREYWEKK